MDIVEFFDPNNKGHVKAWCHLEQKGQWPKEFWIDASSACGGEPEVPVNWQVSILAKMAKAWIDYELKEVHPVFGKETPSS